MPPKTRKYKKSNQSTNAFSVIEDGSSNDVRVGELIRFHDVRESLNIFSGDDTYLIAKWVEDLEEMGEVCGWSDIELFIYSKWLLAGIAAFYLRFEFGIRLWAILINRLLNESKIQINSADVHKQLTTRVKNNEETYQQYMFKMMEIAKQGDVVEDVLLDYIISGI